MGLNKNCFKLKTNLCLNFSFLEKNNVVSFFQKIHPVCRQKNSSFSLHQDLENANLEDVIRDVRIEGAERGIEEGARSLGIESSGYGKSLPLTACYKKINFRSKPEYYNKVHVLALKIEPIL